jgi:hypothetical protein
MLYKILDLGGVVSLDERFKMLESTNSGWRKDMMIWFDNPEHPVHLFLSM